MTILILKRKPTIKEVNLARQDYHSYIKITADLVEEKIAIGGEYHVEAEKRLLVEGSKQQNIWGGGINLETGLLETSAIINIRPSINPSTEILDGKTRQKFIKLVTRVLTDYVSSR
jgi:hypothetical protein